MSDQKTPLVAVIMGSKSDWETIARRRAFSPNFRSRTNRM